MNRPSIERLKELLDIDAGTGVIRWKKGQGRAAAGAIAGRINGRGYRELTIDKRFVMAHAVIYFYAYQDWPERIDHINGNRLDNRLVNLREADAASNARNRTNWVHRKLLGAHKLPSGKWAARITADGLIYDLGHFETEQQAADQYKAARVACDEAEKAVRRSVLQAMAQQSA